MGFIIYDVTNVIDYLKYIIHYYHYGLRWLSRVDFAGLNGLSSNELTILQNTFTNRITNITSTIGIPFDQL